MKKIYLYSVILLLGYACSSGGSDPEPDPIPENRVPSVPTKVFPLNNTLCIDNAINFEWNPSNDPDGDTVRYRVEISENANFTNLIESKSVSNAVSTIITLDKGLSFFWRVRAIDSKNAESDFSVTSQFLTEGDGETNHLPFVPELVSPTLNEVISGTSTTLSWTAIDADNDALTFDVYLDTSNDPTTKVAENLTTTSYEASGLAAATTYYFKVVVKDDKGGATIGQVWTFSTN
ncbi:fibronectin type III domain-containing protein [Hyunsoonleella sp. 2307UL5-6]|uniref:fibronectin type III domain-containing protein n=1 Tax=Hyunsoonleella sp. 2307UL5-6 TaxID=3384768 RepID=UPI0039BC633A